MNDITPRMRVLHEHFNRLTGHTITFDTRAMFMWEKWSARYKLADLEIVVRYLKSKQNKGWFAESLGFRNLIGDISRFDECLSFSRLEAKQSAARREDNSERSQTLRATGRPTQKERPVVKAGEISQRLLNRNEFVAALRKLREEL